MALPHSPGHPYAWGRFLLPQVSQEDGIIGLVHLTQIISNSSMLVK